MDDKVKFQAALAALQSRAEEHGGVLNIGRVYFQQRRRILGGNGAYVKAVFRCSFGCHGIALLFCVFAAIMRRTACGYFPLLFLIRAKADASGFIALYLQYGIQYGILARLVYFVQAG